MSTSHDSSADNTAKLKHDKREKQDEVRNHSQINQPEKTKEYEAPVRKRGRPRKPPQPPKEKKKIGRPKDETKCNITCDICGKFFKHHCDYVVHERSHFGIKEYECEFCHKRFVQSGHLTVHRRVHTGEKPYKCPHCPERFRVQALLDSHIFGHTGQGSKCPQCHSMFRTKAQASQHFREVHATEKSFVCQICGQSYKMRRSLKMHLASHDKRVCSVCGKVFNTVHALMTHRHIHELNHKCDFCNRSFKTEEELQAHSKKFRGRAYQCDMCCYSFNKAEFLDNHNRRDHWKELGLERLPRKNAKPENGQVRSGTAAVKNPALSSVKKRQKKPKGPVVAPTVQPEVPPVPAWLTSVDLNSVPNIDLVQPVSAAVEVPSISSAEKSPPRQESVKSSNIQPKLPAVPAWLATVELLSPKSEEVGNQDQSDQDQDYSGAPFESEDDPDDGENLQRKVVEDIDRESKMSVKLEPENLSLKPEEFLKVEIGQEEDDVVPKEVATEKPPVEKEQSSSDSEDDDVPLSMLVSRQPGRLSKSALTEPKSKVDSQTKSSDLSSDETDSSVEKIKKKRGRKRKNDGEGPRKKIYRKRDITCRFCGEVFKGQVALREHKISAHPNVKPPSWKPSPGPAVCEICGKSYKTVYCLAVHRGQHEEYQRFKCDECPKAFVYQSHLANHKRMDHLQERHICPQCGKQYKYSVDLRHHILRHKEDRPFKCDECQATFTHSTALHGHKAIHRQAVFTCTICDRNFRFASSLRWHKKTHNKDNYVRCEFCDREFAEKTQLKKHMAVHSVDREVKCVVCDKVYYKKVELMIHQAKEHPNHPLIGKTIKIYTCNECGMEFSKESHLRSHSYIHGTEYSFKCDMCEDQKFKQKAGLRNHWKRFHNLEPPKRNLRKPPETKTMI